MGHQYQDTVGSLKNFHPGKNAGKKLFEWIYVHPSFDGRGSVQNTAVQVSYHVEGDERFFSATCELLAEKIHDTDINRLYERTFDTLEENAKIITDVEWEDWLEITVSGATIDHLNSSRNERKFRDLIAGNMNIHVVNLKRAIHPRTGEPVTVNTNGAIIPFPKPQKITDNTVKYISDIKIHGSDIKETAYVPATEKNIKVLKSIVDRLENLRLGLSDLLSHDNIGALNDIEVETSHLLPSP